MPDPRTPLAEPVTPLANQTQSDPTVTLSGETERGSASLAFLSPSSVVGDLGRFGGYRVVKLLGEGGMGFVFRAEDESLQRPIALKVMRPEVAAKPHARDRFLREGRAAAAIKSDHVTIIHQVGESNGVAFLAMEYLDGCTLDDWLKEHSGAVPVAAVAKVAKDVLRGLAAAHEKGLVHRDIKPANLWMEARTGRVKVLDFGLTRAQDGGEKLTADGTVVGTPAYMAPEQASGKEVDGRADLFSLGVVLHRMLAGRSPFQRAGVLPTLGAVMYDDPPPAASLSAELPPVLAGMIDRLLAKEPADRPASANAALAELVQAERHAREEAASGSLPVVVPPANDPWADIDVTQPVPNIAAGLPAGLSDAPQPKTAGKPAAISRKRRPWLLIAAGLAFVAGAVALGQIVIKVKNKDGSETEIKVPKDATVTVTKDGKEVAKVGPEAAKGVPEVAKSDRAAALWVLSIGGTVSVNGRDDVIKAVADLPREAVQLSRVFLEGNKQVSNAGLASFKDCKNLTHLNLGATDTQLSEDGLANFKECKNLTFLHLSRSQANDEGLANFKECKNLTFLHLDATQVSDTGLAHFKDCRNLRDLVLTRTNVTAAKFEELKKAFPKCKIETDYGTYEPK